MAETTDDIWDVIKEIRCISINSRLYSLDGMFYTVDSEFCDYISIYRALCDKPNVILVIHKFVYFVSDDNIIVLSEHNNMTIMSSTYAATNTREGRRDIRNGRSVPDDINQIIRRIHALVLAYQRILL